MSLSLQTNVYLLLVLDISFQQPDSLPAFQSDLGHISPDHHTTCGPQHKVHHSLVIKSTTLKRLQTPIKQLIWLNLTVSVLILIKFIQLAS